MPRRTEERANRSFTSLTRRPSVDGDRTSDDLQPSPKVMKHHLQIQLAKARVDELARDAANRRLISNPQTRRATHRPHRLGAWSAFTVVAGIIGLALFASAAPSPLYADYAARWHFSTPVLTVVFAAYALGALTALLLVGRLSDDLGRRPLLAAGLAGLLGAMLLFALARSWSGYWPRVASRVRCCVSGGSAAHAALTASRISARPLAVPVTPVIVPSSVNSSAYALASRALALSSRRATSSRISSRSAPVRVTDLGVSTPRSGLRSARQAPAWG